MAAPPANLVAPTVSGTTEEGETLTANPGVWSTAATFAYVWARGGAGCAGPATAAGTGPAYALTAADRFCTLRVTVTATNARGSTTLASAESSVVGPAPAPPRPPQASDVVAGAAGDIACAAGCSQTATSNLLLGASPPLRAVLPLGDDVYECGTLQNFTDVYGPSWGRLKDITRPVPGNHEHYAADQGVPCTPPGPSGYFQYFAPQLSPFGAAAGDPARGYYSYDLGAWHVVALNTSDTCSPASCSATSAQVPWLKADLAASARRCTLAYLHHPLVNASLLGVRGYPRVKPLWDALQADGAEAVLAGHVHHYERWKPQTPEGVATQAGIREFVVGTGGRSREAGAAAPNLSSMIDDAFGVLLLALHDDGYSWRFRATAGSVRDQGFTACH